MPDGDATFSNHKVNELAKINNVSVYFEDDNLDDLVKKLKQKTNCVSSITQRRNILVEKSTFIRLTRNKTILFKAGKNRKNPPWRIN